MNELAKILLGVIALPVLWLASGFVYETAGSTRHGFRLTVEVDTPEGLKSGSGVIQVSVIPKASWLPQSTGVYFGVHGEAVMVDLGRGRNVIAILGLGPTGQGGIENLASLAFDRRDAFWWREAPNWTGRKELPFSAMPTLVTFGNLNDPETAEVVAPEDFERRFGAGVRFRRATIEMMPVGWWPANTLGLSGEPITRGIEKRWPLLIQHNANLNRQLTRPGEYDPTTFHFLITSTGPWPLAGLRRLSCGVAAKSSPRRRRGARDFSEVRSGDYSAIRRKRDSAACDARRSSDRCR